MRSLAVEKTKTPRVRDLQTQPPMHDGLLVLIADDEEAFCWALTKILEDLNYAVLCAHTSGQALGLLKKDQQIGFVLMDVRLPDVGMTEDLSLLKRIKTFRSHMPVIVMSAFGTPELKREAQRLGALAFLDKPFRVEQLLRFMREAMTKPIVLDRGGHEFASQ